ncbi:unnamed protein product [Moneuplotes crassus]|uniref:Uncharacterized protein n=1 Tax=Euplotes crassus TaxID=5936 RepID=A0AAD1XJE4_EUPCR|nr:unnamed protein product [Moneuplotes crassus]
MNKYPTNGENIILTEEMKLDAQNYFYRPYRTGNWPGTKIHFNCMMIHNRKYHGRMLEDINICITRWPKDSENTYSRFISSCIFLSMYKFNERSISKFLKTLIIFTIL